MKNVKKQERGSAAGAALKGLTAAALGLAGGWIAYSNTGIDHDLPLPKAIETEQGTVIGGSGILAYYASRAGSGRPLVLLHSINAAASSYEMKPIFEYFQGKRPVFALDWPGFGFSERSDRVYSPELYEQALLEFLRAQVNEPADVVALSLGCEFAARAAMAEPSRFHSLVFISPSGFSESPKGDQDGSGNFAYNALSFPLWGRPFYDLLATRPSIHYFLQMSFEGTVDQGLEDYAYQTAHQPGAQYAPLYFVSGKLFTPDIYQSTYERLRLPVVVLYDIDPFVRFDRLPDILDAHQNWRAVRVAPTKGLPQFERPNETFGALEEFWARIATTA